jgi:hypothetical protein
VIELAIISDVKRACFLGVKGAAPNMAASLTPELYKLPGYLKQIRPLFYLFYRALRDHRPYVFLASVENRFRSSSGAVDYSSSPAAPSENSSA